LFFERILGKEKDNVPYIEWYDSDSPNISDYIKKRLQPQIVWYDEKSKVNMYRYHILQLLTIFFGVLIPVINIVPIDDNDFVIRIISAILGSIIVGITGLLQLTKAQESWILFRSTAETLKREYNLYMFKTGDYSSPNLTDETRNKMFIERIEAIITMEGTKYFSFKQKSESAAKQT
jgi:hypothetical protein